MSEAERPPLLVRVLARSLVVAAASTLAGDRITNRVTHAPGNGAPIGGLKLTTENGWFAVRPSGTEDVYKLYAESFLSRDHLGRIQEEAKAMIRRALGAGP